MFQCAEQFNVQILKTHTYAYIHIDIYYIKSTCVFLNTLLHKHPNVTNIFTGKGKRLTSVGVIMLGIFNK